MTTSTCISIAGGDPGGRAASACATSRAASARPGDPGRRRLRPPRLHSGQPASDGTAITGVIDISPPILAGARAFDLAALLFYRYDDEPIRHLVRARLLELAGPRAARACLGHMVLRQADWPLVAALPSRGRSHPASPAPGQAHHRCHRPQARLISLTSPLAPMRPLRLNQSQARSAQARYVR
jgi:hypothetical protein